MGQYSNIDLYDPQDAVKVMRTNLTGGQKEAESKVVCCANAITLLINCMRPENQSGIEGLGEIGTRVCAASIWHQLRLR